MSVAISQQMPDDARVSVPRTQDSRLKTDVELARGGSRAAFSRLHDRYAGVVHAVVLARVPVQEADDLVQEVFLTAWRTIGGLRDPEAIGPWLMKIARNISVRFHRRRRPTANLPDELAGHDNARGSAAGHHEETARVLAALRTLPESYRETLMMRLVEGLSGPEIAARTGLTPGSVRVNLHRGMHQLRRRLGLDGASETAS